MLPGALALGEVGLVAAAVHRDLLLGEVELDDAVHGAGEELAVVADDDGAGAQPADEALEPVQAVEVEVVRRLVEEEDVVPGEEQRGEPRPRRLAAGEHRRLGVERDEQTEVRRDRLGPLLEVRSTEAQPALQGRRVGVVGAWDAAGERVRRVVQRRLRVGHAGASGEEGRDRLARAAVRLLRQVSHRRGGGGEAHRTRFGRLEAGEQPQQRGLAGTVGADEPDDVPGRDDEVEPGEQDAVAVGRGEAAGEEGCAHDADDATRAARQAVDNAMTEWVPGGP